MLRFFIACVFGFCVGGIYDLDAYNWRLYLVVALTCLYARILISEYLPDKPND